MRNTQSRTYKGKHISMLMKRVKRDLGDDAVILSTTRLREDLFEVRASRGGDLASRMPAELSHSGASHAGVLHLTEDSVIEYETAAAIPAHSEQINPMVHSLSRILVSQGLPRQYREVIMKAVSRVGRAPESAPLAMTDAVADLVKFDPRATTSSKVVALVGPTGVGKTTTIAKLAANITSSTGAKVGLICADLYRIGAALHLQAYANVMNCPFRMVMPGRPHRSELERAISALKECEVILVDTAGCSPSEEGRIEELSKALALDTPIERLLVLPAPSNEHDLRRCARAFEPTQFSRVVVTKLDESGHIGPVVSTVAALGLPVAFFGTGQRVPEDLEPASAARLAWMLSRPVH